MEKELAENPRLNVDAVRTMMSAAGQKPNEAKVRQTYNQIIKQQNKHLQIARKKKIMVGSWDVNLSFYM